jgi:hypothetical protein
MLITMAAQECFAIIQAKFMRLRARFMSVTLYHICKRLIIKWI